MWCVQSWFQTLGIQVSCHARHINTVMHKYLVTVRIKGHTVKTTVEAASDTHARLLAEWHWGIGSVITSPRRLEEAQPTPQQQRVDQLKQQLDQAKQSAKLAKLNQQQIKLNQQRTKIYTK